MRLRLSEHWSTISGGLWFLPMLMVIASFLLAILSLWVDNRYSFELQTSLGLIYASSVIGGRELLSTIAGSMMTVTGVVFSITIVTLSLTSNQYGPRLLRNFLSDRGNQIVLGTFLGTFTYTLTVLRTLQESGEGATAPELSISIGAVLALVSLGVLIYFIHHISQDIQASSILSGVGHEIAESVNVLFPEQIGSPSGEEQHEPARQAAPDPGTAHHHVTAPRAGYVRAINPDQLVKAAVEHNAIIHLDVQPGSFVNENGVVARTWAALDKAEPLAGQIQGAMVIAKSRTPFQDIQFLVSQLVQSALLALSPGVNNSLVAIEAIDWIGASLARIAERGMPQAERFDDEGKLRVIADPPTFASLMADAFDPLRESANANTLVTIHMLRVLEKLLDHALRLTDRAAIAEQARLLHESGLAGVNNDYDRERLHEAYRRVSIRI